ncbi:hypothetical protein K8R14_04785 [bacterium]|nr:hypothetical protein [bacterium]
MTHKSETGHRSSGFTVQRIESPPISPKYIQKRDNAWKRRAQEGAEVGKEFYNGVLYRYLDFDEGGIKLGLMSYSDRLFKKDMTTDEIEREFGDEHNMIHCIVEVVMITTDGMVVVGEKAMTTDLQKGQLAHVSGNMNHDEVEVNTSEDVFKMAMMEIEEEANVQPKREKLFFVGVVQPRTYFGFNFVYLLDISSEQVNELNKEGEFLSFKTMSLDEMVNTDQKGIADFEDSKEWIEEAVKGILEQ